jgi:hypothetical protein
VTSRCCDGKLVARSVTARRRRGRRRSRLSSVTIREHCAVRRRPRQSRDALRRRGRRGGDDRVARVREKGARGLPRSLRRHDVLCLRSASPEHGGGSGPELQRSPFTLSIFFVMASYYLLRGHAQEGAGDGRRGACAMKLTTRGDWKTEPLPDARRSSRTRPPRRAVSR